MAAIFLVPTFGAGWQGFTNAGLVLSGGKLQTYTAGTSTPVATFNSNSGLVQNANPIILDSTGRIPSSAEMWASASIKVVVMDSASNIIATYDNLYGAQDAASLTYNEGQTGAVTRTVSARLKDTVSVRDFGAVGDGVTDDTTAFSNAFASGHTVFIPTATYVTAALNVPAETIVIGDTLANTIILPKNTVGAGGFWTLGPDTEISHLSFNLSKTTFNAAYPLYSNGASFVNIHDCNINQGGGIAIYLTQCTDCTIQRNFVANSNARMIAIDGVNSARNKVFNNTVQAGGVIDHGIAIQGGIDHQVGFNTVTGATGFNISVYGNTQGTQRVNVFENLVWNSIKEAINVTDAPECNVSHNTVYWTGGVATDFGMSVSGQVASCNSTKFRGNRIINAGKSGIAIATSTGIVNQFCMIEDNYIENCNQTTQTLNNGSGINLYAAGTGTTLNCIVQDNYVFDNTNKLVNGVDDSLSNSTGNKIINNRIINPSGKNVNKLTVSTEALTTSALVGWTPTITSSGGAITSTTINSAGYYEVEKMTFYQLDFTITNNGTGTGSVIATLPFTNGPNPWTAVGRETVNTGSAILAIAGGSSNQLTMLTYANAYPGATNSRIVMSGMFMRA